MAAAQEGASIPERTITGETVPKIGGSFTVAAVGDIIMPQPVVRGDAAFVAAIAPLREADVGFANMESSIVDFARHTGPVYGTLAPMATAEAMKAMGIDLVTHANNHAFDGGLAGLESTDAALDKLGIVHAGTGRHLMDARSARFLETPKGRVGLVGMFSVEDVGNFGPTYARTLATLRNGDLGGAAGVNPLGLTTYHIVSADHLARLREMAKATYGERAHAFVPAANGKPDRFRYFDEWYEAGADVGALHYDMAPADEQGNLAAIRNGKVQSDFLIATIHAHQTDHYCGICAFGAHGGMKEAAGHYPPDFLVKLAHDAIDNGADMFVTHGVHALAGVEIYKGRPIFYGLSNFVFQTGMQQGASYDVLANEKNLAPLENDESQIALLATSRFDNGKLIEIHLHPVDLGGARRPLSQMGIPQKPDPAQARKILAAVAEYSRPFGTSIAIRDGVGIVEIAAKAAGKYQKPSDNIKK